MALAGTKAWHPRRALLALLTRRSSGGVPRVYILASDRWDRHHFHAKSEKDMNMNM